jgi:hypothetical protein
MVDDILDLGQHFFTVQHNDRPLYAMVNGVGLSSSSLPILLNFLHSYTFRKMVVQA